MSSSVGNKNKGFFKHIIPTGVEEFVAKPVKRSENLSLTDEISNTTRRCSTWSGSSRDQPGVPSPVPPNIPPAVVTTGEFVAKSVNESDEESLQPFVVPPVDPPVDPPVVNPAVEPTVDFAVDLTTAIVNAIAANNLANSNDAKLALTTAITNAIASVAPADPVVKQKKTSRFRMQPISTNVDNLTGGYDLLSVPSKFCDQQDKAAPVSARHRNNENGGIFRCQLPANSLYTAFILQWLYGKKEGRTNNNTCFFWKSLIWLYLIVAIIVQLWFAIVFLNVTNNYTTSGQLYVLAVGNEVPEARNPKEFLMSNWLGLLVLSAKFAAAANEVWSMLMWISCFKIKSENSDDGLKVQQIKYKYTEVIDEVRAPPNSYTGFIKIWYPTSTITCSEWLLFFVIISIKFVIAVFVFWISSTVILHSPNSYSIVSYCTSSWFLLELSGILGTALLSGTNMENICYNAADDCLVFGFVPKKNTTQKHDHVFREYNFHLSRIGRLVFLFIYLVLGLAGYYVMIGVMANIRERDGLNSQQPSTEPTVQGLVVTNSTVPVVTPTYKPTPKAGSWLVNMNQSISNDVFSTPALSNVTSQRGCTIGSQISCAVIKPEGVFTCETLKAPVAETCPAGAELLRAHLRYDGSLGPSVYLEITCDSSEYIAELIQTGQTAEFNTRGSSSACVEATATVYGSDPLNGGSLVGSSNFQVACPGPWTLGATIAPGFIFDSYISSTDNGITFDYNTPEVEIEVNFIGQNEASVPLTITSGETVSPLGTGPINGLPTTVTANNEQTLHSQVGNIQLSGQSGQTLTFSQVLFGVSDAGDLPCEVTSEFVINL